jgi:hypothetical protein
MCPQCGKVVPAACVIALSDGMICPHCQARLEVATGSRMLAVTAGLIAGWLAWRLTRDSTNILGFALPRFWHRLCARIGIRRGIASGAGGYCF